jgi:predicted glycoside hydrolase/deacetylase ChbG (UPF0249 family)
MTAQPTKLRYLIVNADDFGQSAGINRGIMEAHERGIVTSASLMTRWPAAREAARYARRHPSLSLGLHFDFGEWRFSGRHWSALYSVAPIDDVHAIRREARRQLNAFRMLRDADPTHLDSHQHIHRRPALQPIFLEIANESGVLLRGCSPRIRYYGGFYGQDDVGRRFMHRIRVEGFLECLREIRHEVTELGCHPGYAGGLDSTYGVERAVELETLCAPEVRAALAANSIELASFARWGTGASKCPPEGPSEGERRLPCGL